MDQTINQTPLPSPQRPSHRLNPPRSLRQNARPIGKNVRHHAKLGLLALASIASAALVTSCRIDDVTIGVGVGGGSAYYPYYPYDPYYPGYYPGGVIVGGGGHWGGGHRHWGGGRRGRGWDASATETKVSSARTFAAEQAGAVNEFAQVFKMPVAKSQAFKSALDASAAGQTSALKSLGLTDDDVKLLSQNRELPTASVGRLANALSQNPDDTSTMLTYMMKETQKQATDVKSPLWARCTVEGAWTTPQNQLCRDVNWPGCSPDTGATFCIPKK